MNFRIIKTPDTRRYPLGTILSLNEAAQLMEVNAAQLKVRSRFAAAMRDDVAGVKLEILHDRKTCPECGSVFDRDERVFLKFSEAACEKCRELRDEVGRG